MITKITGSNLKRQSFTMLLGALNLITGRNRRGKTARLDAVRVGLLGYHPRLGKTNGATAKLATGNSMAVRLDFDTSQVPTFHQWTRNGKGWSHEGGCLFKTPEVLLDFREFTGKSGPDRLKYVIERTDIETLGFTVAGLVDAIESARPKEGEYTPAVAKAMRALAVDVNSEAAKLQAKGNAMPQILDGVLAALKLRNTTTKRLLAEITASITGNAREQTEAAPVAAPRPKTVIDADLASLRTTLTQVHHEIQSIEESAAAHNRNAVRKTQLEKWLEGAPDNTAALAETVAKLDALNAQVMAYTSNYATTAGVLAQANGKMIKARAERNTAFDQYNETLKALAELESAEACPHCQSKGKGWKKTLHAHLTQQKEERSQKLEEATQALDLAEMALEKAQQTHEAAEAEDAAHSERRTELTRLHEHRRRLENEMMQRGQVATELATLANMAPAPDTSMLPALEQRRTKLQAEIRTLEAEANRAVAAMQDQLRREQAKAKQAEREAELEALGAAQAVVEAKQRELVAKSMGHLLEVANRFTAGILAGPLEYVEGELGYREDGQWVSLDTFSGTEEAVAYIGLSVALAQEAPLKLVLMDEMGVIDDDNAPQVLARMGELVRAGVIHQFIWADPHRGRYKDLAGVIVHEVA